MMYLYLALALLYLWLTYSSAKKVPYDNFTTSVDLVASILWFWNFVSAGWGHHSGNCFLLGVVVGVYGGFVVRDIVQQRYLKNSEPRWYFPAHLAGLFLFWNWLTTAIANG